MESSVAILRGVKEEVDGLADVQQNLTTVGYVSNLLELDKFIAILGPY